MARILQNPELFMDDDYIKNLPADEGVKYITQIITPTFLSEATGISRSTLSIGVTHRLNDVGTPFYYSKELIARMECVIHSLGEQLCNTQICRGCQSKEQSSICYGDSEIEQIRTLGLYIQKSFLVFTCMKKNKAWYKNRMLKGSNLYGKFSNDDINSFNHAINTAGLRLLGLSMYFTTYEH